MINDVAAGSEFAAGDAGDIVVLDHQARSRDGLTLRRIGVLDLPELLPRVRIEGNDLAIQRGQDDLALDVIHAAMDAVAAGDWDCARILLGVSEIPT